MNDIFKLVNIFFFEIFLISLVFYDVEENIILCVLKLKEKVNIIKRNFYCGQFLVNCGYIVYNRILVYIYEFLGFISLNCFIVYVDLFDISGRYEQVSFNSF